MEVRNGRRFSIEDSEELVVTSKLGAEKFLGRTSQVIVAFNRERHAINKRLRGDHNPALPLTLEKSSSSSETTGAKESTTE
jgi:hypothetical protein